MTERFYIPETISFQVGLEMQLPESETRHAVTVLRKQAGDIITLFDGSGFDYRVEIVSIEKKRCFVRLLEKSLIDRELPLAVHMYSAVPKGKRMDFMIEQLCELGAASFTALHCRYSVVKSNPKKAEGWRKTVLAATKQNGRGVLMHIRESTTFQDAVQQTENPILLHCGDALPALGAVLRNDHQRGENISILIGPEGGFSEDELQFARGHNIKIAHLGKSILRIGTAATAALSAIRLLWNPPGV